MAKRILVLTLSLFLIASLSAFGAKKPGVKAVDERMAQRLERIENANYADESIVSQYLTTPEFKMFFPTTGVAGYSYYDYQANDVQRRMIAKDIDNGVAHLSWMNLVGPEMTNNRYFDYNSYDQATGEWLVAGGMHASPAIGRAGYGGLDLLPDKREVLCYHRTQPDPGMWGTVISVEQVTAGLGEFDTYDIPDSVEGSSEMGFWPTMAIAKDTSSPAYMHITHAEGQTSGGVDKGLGYVRCYEKVNQTTLTCESPGWGAPVDIPANTRYTPNKVPYRIATARLGGITVATSPVSKKVAIVFLQNTAPSQTQNELMYIESDSNGQEWINTGVMTPIQITDYAAEEYEDRAYDDLAVVYDYEDSLHIMWTTFKSDNSNDVSLWHWDKGNGIRKAGFASAGPGTDPGAWNLLIAKFNLGVHPGSNYLYFNYTKFQDGDVSAGGFANGDLHVKASSNGGKTWGPEVNMTNTNTDGCVAPACSSEHWSSLAEVVDDSLHIQYVLDKDAGGIPQDEGTWTNNPIVYFTYPRPPIPAVPSMTYSPSRMISPYRWATNGGSTADEIDFDNVGTATLYVQISGPGYLNISPGSFNIVEAGPTQVVDITFNGGAFADTFLVDKIMIASNHGLVGGAETYVDTQYVPFHFLVTDSGNFAYAEWDSVSVEGDVKVMASNIGNLGHQQDGWMMNYNGYDYLFEFTPAFATPDVDGQGPYGFTWLHEREDFLAMKPFEMYSYPALKTIVIYTYFELVSPRLPWPHHHHWYYWTKKDKLVITKYDSIKSIRIWNFWYRNPVPVWWGFIPPGNPTTPAPGYFGIAADWDVPAEASGRNIGGYDEDLQMAWLTSDSAGFENFYGAFLWLNASQLKMTSDTTCDTTIHYTEPFGTHILTNPNQLYPFGGYNDDSLYTYMSTPGWTIESDSSQDMNIVMSFVEELSPTDSTIIGMEYALLVTDEGLDSLKSKASAVKRVKAGDANVDGNVSVSDVVYLINYLFKGGDEPWLAYSDANGDAGISVSDVVYLINYLFKGGSPPVIVWCRWF